MTTMIRTKYLMTNVDAVNSIGTVCTNVGGCDGDQMFCYLQCLFPPDRNTHPSDRIYRLEARDMKRPIFFPFFWRKTQQVEMLTDRMADGFCCA